MIGLTRRPVSSDYVGDATLQLTHIFTRIPENVTCWGKIAPHRRPGLRAESSHDSICPLRSHCTHLTWNKVDNTTVSETGLRHKSHYEPLCNTLMRQADTAAQTGRSCGRDSPLPRFHPAITCPVAHRFSHTETCMQRAPKHTELI